MNTIIKFKGWECLPVFSEYASNKRTAITLVDAADGEPIAKATVNIAEIDVNDDEVVIKDYSENEGMLDALVSAGVIGKPVRWVNSGHAICPVCKLLPNNTL